MADDNESTQCPVSACARDLCSWRCRSAGVLHPFAAGVDEFVPEHTTTKRSRSEPEGFVGKPADDGTRNEPVDTPPTALVKSCIIPAFQNGLLSVYVLANTGQVEGVVRAESRENRLSHVGDFRNDCVRIPINGSPRRLSPLLLTVSGNH